MNSSSSVLNKINALAEELIALDKSESWALVPALEALTGFKDLLCSNAPISLKDRIYFEESKANVMIKSLQKTKRLSDLSRAPIHHESHDVSKMTLSHVKYVVAWHERANHTTSRNALIALSELQQLHKHAEFIEIKNRVKALEFYLIVVANI